MEVYELAMKLEGLKEVYDIDAAILVDEDECPVLRCIIWFKGKKPIEAMYKYIDNKWVKVRG